jgi:hydrogenase maturation factor
MIFYDPQTSGGLLIAASLEAVESIARRLGKRNYALDYGVIGEVVEGPAGTIFIDP